MKSTVWKGKLYIREVLEITTKCKTQHYEKSHQLCSLKKKKEKLVPWVPPDHGVHNDSTQIFMPHNKHQFSLPHSFQESLCNSLQTHSSQKIKFPTKEISVKQ